MQRFLAGARSWLARSGVRVDGGAHPAGRASTEELFRRVTVGGGEVRELLRRRQWAELGAPREWPAALLGAAAVCIDSAAPMWLVWGPDAVLLYNDAAIRLLGDTHPNGLGRPVRETRDELWEIAGAAIESVFAAGSPCCLQDRLLLLGADGAVEEHYFEIVLSPVLQNGVVAGVLCSAIETTPRVQSARRRATLDDILSRMALAADEQQAWASAAAALERNPADLPYALLYGTDGAGEIARLACAVGVEGEGRRVPAIVEPAAGDAPWPLAYAAELGAPVRWSDALVCPLVPPGGTICGYLIAGLSPRLEADDDYLEFIESAAERIATGVSLAREREDRARRELALERGRRRLEQRCIELTRLFEHAPIPIVVVRGRDFVLDMVNAVATAISGGRAAIGKRLLDALPELAQSAETLRGVLDTGLPASGREAVVRLERKGGVEEAYFTFVAARLDHEMGENARIVVMACDVTEQVRARVALEENEARYRNIFDRVDVSIWEEDFSGVLPLLDEIGAASAEELRSFLEHRPEIVRRALGQVRVTDVNEATVRLFGARAKQELKQSMHRVFLPETHETFAEKLVAVFSRKPLTRIDCAACTLDGERRDLLMTMVGHESNGGGDRALITLTDITEHKRLEQALREADRNKDEFLATLAHELRSPLAPLRSSVDLIRGGGTAPEPVLDIVERQVEHLVRLANDLYETSRIRLGTYDLRTQRVALNDVLHDAIQTSGSLIARSGHELVTDLPAETLWLDGDPVRLSQIFTNLLNNAARYTREPGRITLAVRKVPEGVEIDVSDTGIGIPQEAMPRLFTIFSRVAGEESSADAGLGIGLALAKQLAEMHGGTIEAHSEGAGEGSTFTVRLPLVPPREEGTEPRRHAEESIAGSRILVVEDHVDAAESLRMLLEANGAEVRVATTGPKALAAYARFEPDVVLLDIGLPGMSGYEVARRLRTEFASRDVLLVALTGWGRREDVQRARDAGFDDHMVKPVDVRALRRLLAAARTIKTQRPNGSPGRARPEP